MFFKMAAVAEPFLSAVGRSNRATKAVKNFLGAGWRSLVARGAHNPDVSGSNPLSASSNPFQIFGRRGEGQQAVKKTKYKESTSCIDFFHFFVIHRNANRNRRVVGTWRAVTVPSVTGDGADPAAVGRGRCGMGDDTTPFLN